MGKLAEAYVDVSANLKPMQAGLARAKSMLTSFAAKGVSIGVGLGGAGLAGGLLMAAKKAADLGESVSKVRTAFGRDADSMIEQANQLADKFGVVKQASLDAGAAFGLMGRAAGLSSAASAQLGNEFVKLGLDLASFHNMSNIEAFEKLRSGLAGEAEPLRPLGIMLSEDAVRAEALAMGLVKVKRELTEQEKILARVSLIKKQAGPAIGDFERTIDNSTPAMRRLQGELENAATDFGQKLQGALTSAIKLAHELGDTIKSATGKSLAENVGENSEAAINAVRTVNGPGRGAIGRGMLLGGVANMVGGRLSADEQNKMVEAVAKQTGKPLAAPGIPSMMTRPETPAERQARLAGAPGANLDTGQRQGALAQQRALQMAALQQRDERDKKLAEERQRRRQLADETVAAAQNPKVEELGRKLADGFAKAKPFVQGFLGGGLSGAAQPLIAQGKLTQLKEEERVQLAKIRQMQQPGFQSQSFASGGDFARFAIERALSSPEEDKSQKELEDANKRLEEIRDGIKTLSEMVAKSKPGGVILRGAS